MSGTGKCDDCGSALPFDAGADLSGPDCYSDRVRELSGEGFFLPHGGSH